MTKFYETCNRCDAEVICECPYCEKLLDALAELLDGFDSNYDERCGLTNDQWDKRIQDARTAIKEADNG